LEKRKKKIDKDETADDLTFTNKFTKKASESQLTDTLKKKLTKQRSKAGDNNIVGVPDSEVTKDKVDSRDNKDKSKGKISNSRNGGKKTPIEKMLKPSSRKSSEEQEYFTAAEESILLTRPRRNCKKRFENLEGLACSSASNTPTPGPIEGATRNFQFPTSKTAASESEVKPQRKKPGRKPAKAEKSVPEQTTTDDKSPTKPETVQVIVHSPDESHSQPNPSSHLTPKLSKKAPKGKQQQQVPDQRNTKSKPTSTKPSAENSKVSKPTRSKANHVEATNTNTRRKTKNQTQGVLSKMADEVYQTPSNRIVDEMYQTPQPMGSFSEVLDEEYKTPAETVRKPSTRQRKAK